jgi:hypothetical protein
MKWGFRSLREIERRKKGVVPVLFLPEIRQAMKEPTSKQGKGL